MFQEVIVALVVVILLTCVFKKAHSVLVDDRIFVQASDRRRYKVRNTEHKEETAEALARLNKKIIFFIDRLTSEKDLEFHPAMLRLKRRYNPDTLSEGRIDKQLTSYIVNKGEQMVICMRSRDAKDQIYDDNLIFYVALHELAHVASVVEDHKPEFYRNFRYLLRKASEWNMFQKIFQKFHYCGIDVNGM